MEGRQACFFLESMFEKGEAGEEMLGSGFGTKAIQIFCFLQDLTEVGLAIVQQLEVCCGFL
jgi:hypothetical protein